MGIERNFYQYIQYHPLSLDKSNISQQQQLANNNNNNTLITISAQQAFNYKQHQINQSISQGYQLPNLLLIAESNNNLNLENMIQEILQQIQNQQQQNNSLLFNNQFKDEQLQKLDIQLRQVQQQAENLIKQIQQLKRIQLKQNKNVFTRIFFWVKDWIMRIF